jgi:hypothetical protein
MAKVTSINRDTYLHAYCESQNIERIPEGLRFAVGVLLSIGLPQLTFGIYGGRASVFTFAAYGSVGCLWGLGRYFLQPDQFLSITAKEGTRQSPPREDNRLKPAA